MAAVEQDVSGLRLRQFNWRNDRLAVLSFQYEIYETNFPGCRVDEEFLEEYSFNLREAVRNSSENLLVLEEGGEVVGFIWMSLLSTLVDSCVGYVKNIYVAPHLRSRGYGQRLLEAADEWFRSNGATKATLDASVGNQRAVSLYQYAGYEITRYRMEKHYSDADD